jgi:hypothetical protein
MSWIPFFDLPSGPTENMGTVGIFQLFLPDQVSYILHNATFGAGKNFDFWVFGLFSLLLQFWPRNSQKIAIMKELTQKSHKPSIKIAVLKKLLKKSIIQIFLESFEWSQ